MVRFCSHVCTRESDSDEAQKGKFLCHYERAVNASLNSLPLGACRSRFLEILLQILPVTYRYANNIAGVYWSVLGTSLMYTVWLQLYR